MARNNDRDRGKRAPKDLGRRTKKKPCVFCKDHIEWVDYKDVNLLRRYMSDRGKIRARRVSGNCAQHQRDVAVAIKTARELALGAEPREREAVAVEALNGAAGTDDTSVDVDVDADVDVEEPAAEAEEVEV